MPAEDLNGLLQELTDVLSRLTDCERLWVDRLRDAFEPIGNVGILRSEISPHEDPRPIEWATTPQGASEPSPPDEAAAPERRSWQTPQASSPTGKRDYNYFAQLDEKLARLQDQELPSPELTDWS